MAAATGGAGRISTANRRVAADITQVREPGADRSPWHIIGLDQIHGEIGLSPFINPTVWVHVCRGRS